MTLQLLYRSELCQLYRLHVYSPHPYLQVHQVLSLYPLELEYFDRIPRHPSLSLRTLMIYRQVSVQVIHPLYNPRKYPQHHFQEDQVQLPLHFHCQTHFQSLEQDRLHLCHGMLAYLPYLTSVKIH